MVSRRMMIAGGAGAAVLAALGYRAWDRGVFAAGEGPAYEGWQQWQGRPGEGQTRPLHAAILAASAHNTQPWVFEPMADLSISTRADLSRHIGAADPFRRELYVSIGCAVENLELALRLRGQGCETFIRAQRLSPDPAEQVVDVANTELQSRLTPSERVRRRAAAIPFRHTHRGAYRAGQPVPPAILNAIIAGGEEPTVAVTDPGARRELSALIVEATERFTADPEMSRDSGRWFRTGRRDIASHRDGVTTDTAGLSPLMLTAAKILPDQSVETADKYWLAATRDVHVETAPAFIILFNADRLFSLSSVGTGRAWQRMHLDATAAGLVAQPLNQPIEMMDRDYLLGRKSDYAKDIRKIAGMREGDPAFIFRLGYAEHPAPPSPRRRFEDVIRKTGYA